MLEDTELTSEIPPRPRPNTAMVLLLILAAAMVFSYLSAYAVMNALAANGVISPINHDADPRPRWMLIIFIGLVSVFLILAGVFRFASNRQMSQIDRLADLED
jgi:hypothetical protein